MTTTTAPIVASAKSARAIVDRAGLESAVFEIPAAPPRRGIFSPTRRDLDPAARAASPIMSAISRGKPRERVYDANVGNVRAGEWHVPARLAKCMEDTTQILYLRNTQDTVQDSVKHHNLMPIADAT